MDVRNKQAAKAGTARRSMDGVVSSATQPRQRTTAQSAGAARRPQLSRRIGQPVQRTAPVAAETKDYPLPKYQAPSRPKKVIKHKRRRRLVLALRIASAVVAVFVLTGGFLVWKGYTKFHKVFHGTSTVAALSSKKVVPAQLKGEGDGRVNILLLGVGGPGHDGPDLTDTILILSVDPVNNTAAMVSIPRDLWVDQPVNYFGKQQKINAAYESAKYHYLGKLDPSNKNAAAVEAGFQNVDTVIKQVTDVNISYHLLVNFQAFRQAIDTVGGITVDVPTPLIDPTMAWENHWNSTLAPAGIQQMDGVKALLYARSRETTSDFARSQRQRQILVALKDKVLTAGTLSSPAKIDGLINAFGDNVYSDLSSQGAMRLVGIMKKTADSKVNSLGLTDQGHQLITTDHVGTTSVDRPLAGFGNYTDIQSYIRSQIPDGYLVKEHASVAVVGQTTVSAAATTALLKGYGYSVTSTDVSTAATATPVLVDLSRGKDPYTLHYLASRYGVKAVQTLPAGASVSAAHAKFVIIGGK